MQSLGYTPEEQVDFYISIGLIPQSKRQTTIGKIYQDTSEILADMMGTEDSIV